jgi:hypothetical protein
MSSLDVLLDDDSQRSEAAGVAHPDAVDSQTTGNSQRSDPSSPRAVRCVSWTPREDTLRAAEALHRSQRLSLTGSEGAGSPKSRRDSVMSNFSWRSRATSDEPPATPRTPMPRPHSNSDPEVYRRWQWIEVTKELLPLDQRLPRLYLTFPEATQRVAVVLALLLVGGGARG